MLEFICINNIKYVKSTTYERMKQRVVETTSVFQHIYSATGKNAQRDEIRMISSNANVFEFAVI